jgi:hypothetical protein
MGRLSLGEGPHSWRPVRHVRCVIPTYCENSLSLNPYRTTTDSSMPNQTNLAIKGIIAISAMAKIGSALERMDDAQKYNVRELYVVQLSFTYELIRAQHLDCIHSGKLAELSPTRAACAHNSTRIMFLR